MSDTESTRPEGHLPAAEVQPTQRHLWLWLIPAAAGLFAAGLFITYVVKTGPVIVIRMSEGHGIKPGDVLRCRGIVIGEVESARLSEGLEGVELRVRLEPAAADVARAGSRFWVVRPQLGLGGVGGLETIAGPRYLTVLPGDGPPQHRFIALDEPPVIETIDPDGLEIELVAERRLGLRAGSPILYRQAPIGLVLSVGLASDGASVEARAYIRPAYAALVRDNSRFWSVSGAEVALGVTGLRIEVESLETLVVGGVAVATPDPPGARPSTGHRFTLHAEPDDDWLQWRPSLPVGTELLPPEAARPDMQRATVAETSRLFRRTRQRRGWLLPTPMGLVGPTDLLSSGDDDAALEVAGRSYPLHELRVAPLNGLATAELRLPGVQPWPPDRTRTLEEAEDCVIVTDPATPPVPLAAGRLEPGANGWLIDRSVSLDRSLHGAAVVARRDGRLVGLLIVDRDQSRIAPLTTPSGS